MRGEDERVDALFCYVSLEQRIPGDHPLRAVRELVDAALAQLSRAFSKLYAQDGRPPLSKASGGSVRPRAQKKPLRGV
jgi:hypothetical protein